MMLPLEMRTTDPSRMPHRRFALRSCPSISYMGFGREAGVSSPLCNPTANQARFSRFLKTSGHGLHGREPRRGADAPAISSGASTPHTRPGCSTGFVGVRPVQSSPAFARAVRTTRAARCRPLRPAVCDGGFLDDRDFPIVTIGPFVALDQASDQNGRVMLLADSTPRPSPHSSCNAPPRRVMRVADGRPYVRLTRGLERRL